jgi:hypothetical protein
MNLQSPFHPLCATLAKPEENKTRQVQKEKYGNTIDYTF